jgi:hypothetical protein
MIFHFFLSQQYALGFGKIGGTADHIRDAEVAGAVAGIETLEVRVIGMYCPDRVRVMRERMQASLR